MPQKHIDKDADDNDEYEQERNYFLLFFGISLTYVFSPFVMFPLGVFLEKYFPGTGWQLFKILRIVYYPLQKIDTYCGGIIELMLHKWMLLF